ncbi:MAG: DUF234 domain-containing protein [Coriobacteriaceae bacterium]|jgi:AAA+ ATPase superfamily predicted ATPase|nr:DUF234 domain-containing protein [Coriobacteriaceae bacterium]
MFRFWYKFIMPNTSAITAGLGEDVFRHEVKPQFDAYMGLIFEDVCKQWLYEYARQGSLPFFAGEFGRWWGTNALSREQEEIDIMATRGENALFAECTWSKAPVGVDVYNTLKRKAEMLGFVDASLFLFTKSAFTDELLRMGHKDDRIKLFTLSDMIAITRSATADNQA